MLLMLEQSYPWPGDTEERAINSWTMYYVYI